MEKGEIQFNLLMSEMQALSSLIGRLEKAIGSLEGIVRPEAAAASSGVAIDGSASGSGDATTLAPFVSAFDCMVAEHLNPYYQLSNTLGDTISKQADFVKQLVEKERLFLASTATCKKPTDEAISKWFQNTFSPITEQINAITQQNKRTPQFLNLSTVSEASPMFLWNFFTPTPVSYIHEVIGSSEFHSNKLYREFKDKDQNQIKWVGSFNGFLKAFESYVKKYHTTGATWNCNGQDFLQYVGSPLSVSSTAAAPSVPTAKPAGPSATASTEDPTQSRSNLFSQLNKGSDVTSHLRKVTADMKTKNRADRSGLISNRSSTPASPSSSQTARRSVPAKVYEPKCELQGNRWILEYVKGSVNVNVTEMKQSVYIYNSEGADIVIKGKFNALTLDSAKKTNIVFDEAVSVVEIVNCSSLQTQVVESVPSIVVDKSSGVNIYLSKKSLSTQIVTSKSDSINVSIPGATIDAEPTEFPVPEQFLSSIQGGKIVTVPNMHLGE